MIDYLKIQNLKTNYKNKNSQNENHKKIDNRHLILFLLCAKIDLKIYKLYFLIYHKFI